MKNFTLESLFIVLTIFLLPSCGNSNKTEGQQQQNDIKQVYDVSSLIGKNIDEIRELLGNPTDKEKEPSKSQMKMNIDTCDNSFQKDGETLLVTYNPQDRKVVDFFIQSNDPSGSTDDYSTMLKICNISEDNSSYNVEPVLSLKDESRFTGIRIIPQ